MALCRPINRINHLRRTNCHRALAMRLLFRCLAAATRPLIPSRRRDVMNQWIARRGSMPKRSRWHRVESALVAGLTAFMMLLLPNAASAQVAFKLDHFKCYITTDDPVNQQVKLQDQFDKKIDPAFYEDVLVWRSVRLCNPVEKIRLDTGQVTPINNPESHLKLYRMFPDDLDLAPTRKVLIENQFGKKTIRTFDAEVLAVPTSKSFDPGVFQPFHDLDHFKCYRAYGGAVNKLVTLRDQFHTEENVKVGYPFGFCNPTVKIHGVPPVTTPITNAEDHLVCYKITQKPLPTGLPPVFTRNQFRLEQLTVQPADLLCVPSKKLKWSSQPV
jgi:hypothetical protein